MHANEYVPLLLKNSILPGYKKGTFSECLVIDQGSLDNLERHNTDAAISFNSDFATFIIEAIEKAKQSMLWFAAFPIRIFTGLSYQSRKEENREIHRDGPKND